MNSEEIRDQVITSLDDMKGEDIHILDIGDISDFADYMVIVSGNSARHVRALAETVQDDMKKAGIGVLGHEGEELSEWILIDFADVVVHVMRPEVRKFYDLEKLWDEDIRKLVARYRDQDGG
jgi:ribosome-associated protein